MRIAFVNPPFKFTISRASRWVEKTKSGTIYYPIFLCYAAGVAEKNGHEIFLIDAIARNLDFDMTIALIDNFKPDILVCESSTPSIKSDVSFIERYKNDNPRVKTVLVGTHPSALPDETMKMSKAIDFIAKHEYDYTIVDLAKVLDGLKRPSQVDGLVWREGDKITSNKNREMIKNLDDIPMVSEIYKRFLRIEDYRYSLAMHPMIQVLSSRGCPNMCTFCLYPQVLMGRAFRPRSAEDFVKELAWIYKNLKVKEIFIEDDTFTVDKARVMRICDLITQYDMKLNWSCNARADIPYDVLVKMKEAGCRMVIVGYESGNQGILNTIKKGITIQMAEDFTADAKRAGLKIFGCFMIGLPGETKETIEETFTFAKRLRPDMVFFQQAVPFPGTEFYNWCKMNKYITAKDWDEWLDKNGQLDCIVSYPDLTKEEICKLKDRLMIRYYTSPKHIAHTIKHNMSASEMKRLGKAGTDYLKYLIKRRTK
ncbi:MAG: B12-binding domain-containing radical SAM protein [Nanoarchaeota archaeon]|nr:B12-binding domain-containing radical SAM protein [Nanoarchaeota archaeon]